MTAPRPFGELAPALPALLESLTHSGIGVVVFGQRAGVIEKWYANEAAIGHLGYTVDEWLAKPTGEVIAPQHRAQVMHMYERFAMGDPVPATVEFTFIHRDGHHVRSEFSVGRCSIPDGNALVLVLNELRPQQQARLSLLEADRIALVGALASGFAHETNNPLTSVLLNLRSLRKQLVAHLPDASQAAALRCLDDITTGAERIASNVRALQTLATRSATQTIDLAAVVSAALRLAAPTLEPRAHVIRQVFPVAPVAGEEARIGQAVLAMMLFSSSGFDPEVASTSNRIVVTVEERAGSVVVEVSDNGRDLTTDEVQRAFDPFFQSSVRGAGVGVGLGVARSVAATLGGEVTLVPRPEGGAVITMRLPPAPRDATA